VPSFKATYLIHGDDHGRIAERRTRLRAMAEAESGTAGVEVFEADGCTSEAVALALSAMTFAIGRRFVIADGVERWKDADAEQVAAALAGVDPEALTVAFFAREEGRFKVPESLVKAVKAAHGAIAEESQVKPRELPRWLSARAKELELDLDNQAARALIAQVGDRQQRLLRELEKLALEHGEGATIGVEEVEGGAALSAEQKVWALGDALVGGDRSHATRAFLELRGQGEALQRLVPIMAKRVRDVLAVAVRLEAGQSPAQVKAWLTGDVKGDPPPARTSPWQADQRIKEARGSNVDALQRALEELATLELASRGESELSDDTAALRAIAAMTG
jgi:DNA polymerase-3 subunit delta